MKSFRKRCYSIIGGNSMRNYNIGLDEGFDDESIVSLLNRYAIVKKIDAVRHNFFYRRSY